MTDFDFSKSVAIFPISTRNRARTVTQVRVSFWNSLQETDNIVHSCGEAIQ